ncbi:MAG TPA: hypothetical protein VL961_08580 [Acidimicrobiales bacterium]|nr:hypothetical protein [Acidimicrobiales bacterium]
MNEKKLEEIIGSMYHAGPGTKRIVRDLAEAVLELAQEVTKLRTELDTLTRGVPVATSV